MVFAEWNMPPIFWLIHSNHIPEDETDNFIDPMSNDSLGGSHFVFSAPEGRYYE
jgi:hypothetical protein